MPLIIEFMFVANQIPVILYLVVTILITMIGLGFTIHVRRISKFRCLGDAIVVSSPNDASVKLE